MVAFPNGNDLPFLATWPMDYYESLREGGFNSSLMGREATTGNMSVSAG